VSAFRFLHLADLHLETSFGGRPETRDRLRRATRDAFERGVELALRERLHAVLVAGDLFDDGLLSLRTEAWLVRQVRRLADAGIWFLAACGNHDPGAPAQRMARLAAGDGSPAWRAHVRVFSGPEPTPVEVGDAHGRAVAVVVGAGHPSESCAENLAQRFPDLPPRLPVVGLLHTQVDGAQGAERHERYAPSTRADYEARRGYAYWALGHVHQAGRALEGLPVFYAGNLQGRNPRESGPKGGYLVEAHAGLAAEPRFVRLGPVRWVRVPIEVAAGDSATALVDALGRRIAHERESEGEEIAVVLELSGETALGARLRAEDERRALEEDLAAGTGALEVQLRDAGLRPPIDRQKLREAPSVLAEALRLLERAAQDEALLLSFAPETLAQALPGAAPRPEALRELLAGLEPELVQRFLPDAPAGGRP
jgi:exonuclease SbcD